MNESEIVFSICVPTYNRGRKALALVKDVMPGLEHGRELIIIDNCSTGECEEYAEIAELAQASSGRLVYIHNETGVGFHGNYMNCFRYPRGNLVMLVSDEDRPNPGIIPVAVKLLKEHPGTGIIRGSISPLLPEGRRRNSIQLQPARYVAGREALGSYALFNNYFSGTIYNAGLLKQFGLVARLERQLSKQKVYPHLYLEGLACAVVDVALCSEISCFEGEPQQLVGGGPDDYEPPYSFGGRLDQFLVLRDCLREAVEIMGMPFDSGLFVNLYLRHTAKFIYLVGRANAGLYAKNGIDVGVAVRAFAYFACAAMIRLKECEPHRDFIMEKINKLAVKFGG